MSLNWHVFKRSGLSKCCLISYLVSLLLEVGFQVRDVADYLEKGHPLVKVPSLGGLSVHLVHYLPHGLLEFQDI